MVSVKSIIINFVLQMVTRTKKIFVGGVSASTTEEDLTNFFKQYGEASCTLIIIFTNCT